MISPDSDFFRYFGDQLGGGTGLGAAPASQAPADPANTSALEVPGQQTAQQ